MEEKILCAAIWYKELPTQRLLPKNIENGIVVLGHRHGHCIDIVKQLSGLRTVQIASDGVGDSEQGFLTNTNRFVDRIEGRKIAFEAGQLAGRDVMDREQLYSEDLY